MPYCSTACRVAFEESDQRKQRLLETEKMVKDAEFADRAYLQGTKFEENKKAEEKTTK